jgi:anti-sigma regulatory factor (Ser/Thr protein kinase)
MASRVRTLYKIDRRPDGPARARRIIAEELASRLPAQTLAEVELMVSELVTTGVVHGGGDEDAPLVLDVCINGEIRCRVLDRGPGFATRARRNGPGGQWALQVVEQLADRWGMQCSRSPHRTEVWFERRCA